MNVGFLTSVAMSRSARSLRGAVFRSLIVRRRKIDPEHARGFMPWTHEKGNRNDLLCPYLELVQVPLAEKAQPCRENPSKGTRQVSSISLVEGVPAFV